MSLKFYQFALSWLQNLFSRPLFHLLTRINKTLGPLIKKDKKRTCANCGCSMEHTGNPNDAWWICSGKDCSEYLHEGCIRHGDFKNEDLCPQSKVFCKKCGEKNGLKDLLLE